MAGLRGGSCGSSVSGTGDALVRAKPAETSLTRGNHRGRTVAESERERTAQVLQDY
jgi:hypothetical protein